MQALRNELQPIKKGVADIKKDRDLEKELDEAVEYVRRQHEMRKEAEEAAKEAKKYGQRKIMELDKEISELKITVKQQSKTITELQNVNIPADPSNVEEIEVEMKNKKN